MKTRTLQMLLLLLLLPGMAAAEPPPHYRVELLVFARIGAGDGGERWPQVSSRPQPYTALGPGAEADAQPETPRTLEGARQVLLQSGGYRPLLHLAWRQPALDQEQARPVWIAQPSPPQAGEPKVEGTARIMLRRFLHLQLDLVYLPRGEPEPWAMDAHQSGIFHLAQRRRVRPGEIHYFDHPRFGVLAVVERAPASEPPPEGAVPIPLGQP